jgi:hypothetical protein
MYVVVKETHKLTEQHLQFIDWEEVFFAIEQFKNERGWYNLELKVEDLQSLMANNDWYTLKVPQETMRFKNFGKDVATWQEITVSLLKLFVDVTYKKSKGKHESDHQIVEILNENDPNFIDKYTIEVSRKHEDWINRIMQLSQDLSNGTFMKDKKDMPIVGSGRNGVTALQFDNHLFNPIFYMNNDYAKKMDKESNQENWFHIAPVALNNGEHNFVEAVKAFFEGKDLKGKEVYLLRNTSKKGMGFFETEGFYPDFILWIREGEKQYLTFIDPKGIQHLKAGKNGQLENENVQLLKHLAEEIAPKLHDQNLVLNSFILSDTPYSQVLYKNQYEYKDFTKNHVLFQNHDKYVETMINMIESA